MQGDRAPIPIRGRSPILFKGEKGGVFNVFTEDPIRSSYAGIAANLCASVFAMPLRLAAGAAPMIMNPWRPSFQ